MFTGKAQKNLLPQERVEDKAFAVVGVRTEEVDHSEVISPKLGGAEAKGLCSSQPAGRGKVRGYVVLSTAQRGLVEQRGTPWRGPSHPATSWWAKCGGQLATLPS